MTTSAVAARRHRIRIDSESRQAFAGTQPVELTAREFEVLQHLVERRGAVVDFDEFAREVWGYELAGDRHFIQAAVWRLRRTLTSAGAADPIETVPGVGYVIRNEAPDLTQIDGWHDRAPVLIVNREGQIRFANEAASQLTGYPLEELCEMNATEIWEPGEDDVHRALREGALQNSSAAASGLARLGGGALAPIDISLTPLALGTEEALFLITAKPAPRSSDN